MVRTVVVRSKVGTFLFGLVFLVIGGGIAWIGGVSYVGNQQFARIATRAQGTVTNVETSIQNNSNGASRIYYTPTVEFKTPDGKDITFKGTEERIQYVVGDLVSIMYDPANPYNAHTASSVEDSGGNLMIILVGIFFALMGLFLILRTILTIRKDRWLSRNGTAITVPILRVEQNNPARGALPLFSVVAQWQDPQNQKIYIFKSDPLSYDPSAYIAGKQVSVMIDPNNPNRYEMDTSSLSKEGGLSL